MCTVAKCLFGVLTAALASIGYAQSTQTFRVTQDWGSGFQGEITIKNTGSSTLTNWTLEFDFAPRFTSVWDGVQASRSGTRTVIKNAGWNADIAAGATVSFGFVGEPGNVTTSPTNYKLISGTGSGGGGGGTGGGEEGSGAPATPSLQVSQLGSQVVAQWNLYYGNNATRWDLYEDATAIAGGLLTASSPSPQSATFTLPARECAAHKYFVRLKNSQGQTDSNTVVYVFGGASKIVVASIDAIEQATQATLSPNVATTYSLSVLGQTSPTFTLATNSPSVLKATVSGTQLSLTGLKPGRASLEIRDTKSGEIRYLGVRVKNPNGTIPGLPSLGVGSVSEDTPADLAFWRDFRDSKKNKRVDVRYIYLNGGPYYGWRTWADTDGGRLTSYLRESQKLGFIPYFVWYNIPDGGESYFTNKEHIESVQYLRDYFTDLRFALETIKARAGTDPVGFILEPDFIGYIMQTSGLRPDQVLAQTSAAYSSGVLGSSDVQFPNTLAGLVKAINYTCQKYAPNVVVGWQFNLWASPGITVGIPAKGLMRITDTLGIVNGRAKIVSEAKEIAKYYKEAGVTSYGAKFVSIDKYGLDAGAENGAAANPQNSTWFWNLDHWNNYLLFAKTLKQETALPVTLWQLPVGRINHSLFVSPYTNAVVPDLPNTNTKFEDSAPTFFLGDKFTATGNRFTWFSTNQGADPLFSVSGNTIEWKSHLGAASAAGVNLILFGAGVGDSTDGVGSPPTENYWWISKIQLAFPG